VSGFRPGLERDFIPENSEAYEPLQDCMQLFGTSETATVNSVEFLLGREVLIQTIKAEGTSRLNGLKGTVIGLHPIAPNWVQIELYPNEAVECTEWSVPADLLRICPLEDKAFPNKR
jgi:hypothetical protein